VERAPTLTRLTDGLNISALSQERGSMAGADDAGDHRWRPLERAVQAQRVGGGGGVLRSGGVLVLLRGLGAALAVEHALSRIALGLVEAGVGHLIVAGGETSGACVQALGITQLRIGPQIDPGVPWCHAVTPARPTGLQRALKSGNFGGADFFSRADTLV